MVDYIYNIYYIGNNYMFRHFSLAIFRSVPKHVVVTYVINIICFYPSDSCVRQ